MDVPCLRPRRGEGPPLIGMNKSNKYSAVACSCNVASTHLRRVRVNHALTGNTRGRRRMARGFEAIFRSVKMCFSLRQRYCGSMSGTGQGRSPFLPTRRLLNGAVLAVQDIT